MQKLALVHWHAQSENCTIHEPIPEIQESTPLDESTPLKQEPTHNWSQNTRYKAAKKDVLFMS